MRTVIGITGTTSVGKSAVGVELAQLIHGEVISADSMQVYKGMDIGTAKITSCEMQGVKHYMLDVLEPNENFSSFLYQQQASQIIDNMTAVPIVVGGTGFYFDSLIYPPEFGGVGDARRAELKRILDEEGLPTLREILKAIDIEANNTVDLANPKRVLRAIEIAESGGKLSDGVGRNAEPKYDLKLFVLERPRESLYKQIDVRVDEMIEKGLVDEVSRLVNKYGLCDTSAFQAIGYKEIIEYLKGNCSLNDAIARIKLNTRHYSKRQITYFKKMNVLEFINVEDKAPDEIAAYIANTINFSGINDGIQN